MNVFLKFLIKNKALNYPLFRSYLLFRFTLVLALNMQMAIISYMVYRLTKDELSLGMLGLAEVIPAVGCSLFSGHFVDGKEKRNLLLFCTVGYIVLTSFFTILAWPSLQTHAGVDTIKWLIYLGIFIGGILRAFLSPSAFSLFGLIIPRRLYAGATTWSSTSWQLGAVFGPLLGGTLIALTDFKTSLIGVLVIEVISLIAIANIPKQVVLLKAKEPVLKSLAEGLRFVFKTQIVLAVLALDMFAVLFGGAVALLPVFADDILKVGEVGFGWLRAAPGIGSISTLLLLSAIPIKTKPGIKLLICIAGFGVTIIVFGLSHLFLLSFFMLLIGGMFDAVSVVIRGTILQLYTPDQMRGRVAAVNTMFVSSSNELGALESGLTAKWMGTISAVLFGGTMTLVVATVSYFKAPSLKNLDFRQAVKGK